MTFAFLAAGGGGALADPAASAAPVASGTPAAQASPAIEDPAVTAAVKKQFLGFQAGKIDRKDYSDEANSHLTDQLIAQAAAQLQPLGPPKTFTFLSSSTQSGNRIYIYGVDTASTKLQMLYAVDAQGKISGIFFRPAQ